jgi:ribonuclease BN (tRNA processing enzyme)
MSGFKVTLLGTGIPDPKPNRYGSGTLVQAVAKTMIFDCGRCVIAKAVRKPARRSRTRTSCS